MKMKSILTISLSLILVVGATAQKPNIAKAKTLWEQGNLDEAKTMIDAATTYEKTMNDGKTWYYRGLIYASIDTTSNPSYSGLKENAREIALESFAKAEKMDDGKGYAIWNPAGISTMDQQIRGYFLHYFNRAIQSYQEEDFENASILFETANKIDPTDTASMANAGFAAQAYEDYDRAILCFKKSIELGAKGIGTYYNLINLVRLKGDLEQVLAIVSDAKKIYPQDNNLSRQEISALLALGRGEQAMVQLKTTIEKEPNDPTLRFIV